MNREEKNNYVVRDTYGPFDLDHEQEKVKFLIMQDFVTMRKEAGVTQEELSRRTGISRPNIARMENGSYNPTVEMLVRLAAGIGKKVDIRFKDMG
ncbi:MAG: helix-turn-helix transcriptional regulator [Lachnospiraceae bacterium]|jgi:DNA-binding XRE family transcriptional regulator|nr:helix-turn-helix transcriptional regulator [Lachnospiraceae bacterium]